MGVGRPEQDLLDELNTYYESVFGEYDEDTVYRASFLHGHPVVAGVDEVYRYEDGEVVDWFSGRPCPHCGGERTAKCHDACIADLPGVNYACCGHGQTCMAYASFADDREPIYGDDAVAFFDQIKRNREDHDHRHTDRTQSHQRSLRPPG